MISGALLGAAAATQEHDIYSGLALLITAVASGTAAVLGVLNRRSIRTPRKSKSGAKSMGVAEVVELLRSEEATAHADISSRLDDHISKPVTEAHQ